MSKSIKLSATRINCFLSCKQKYWFTYCDKLPKVENSSFKLGLAVHESLEFAGNLWLTKPEPVLEFTKAEKNEVLAKYDEVSIREGVDDYEIHTEGRGLVKKRLDDFATGRRIVSLETKFGFYGKDGGMDVVTDLGVPLIGAIDKVEEYDDDTLLIIDYKTSKTAPTSSQLRSDIQLSIYDLVAKKLYPSYTRVILALDLLKSEMLYTYRTDEEREDFNKYLKAIYDQMLVLEKKDAKPSLHMFCPWCDFRDYCSKYQEACEKSDYKFLPVMHYSDEQLVNEWESVKSTKKILENRERELGMVITDKIKTTSKNLKGGEAEVYIRQNSSTNYDLSTVAKIVPNDDFPNLVNLNKKAVDNYLEFNPSVKDLIAQTSTTNFTKPFLATRKRKDKD